VIVRYLDRKKVLAELRGVAADLAAARPEVQEVRLFGSLAREEPNPYADADLLIILDASDLPYRDRAPVYKPARSPVPLDLIVCTRAELEREVSACDPFIERILAESVTLYLREAAGRPH
jgi:predicted nucleotidyltransferase